MKIMRVKQQDGTLVDVPFGKGADGKSAYQYAKDGGYTGTEAEFTQLLGNLDNDDGSGVIIDCATLPVNNVNKSIIYRTNNIQFVFDRQVGTEGGVPVNVIVVEDVTKLQQADIIPYATSNPTARNWYYDLSRQHGYCYYGFEVPVADKSNSRYDWIDATATEGDQWFDPEWIYRNQNGYGGTVASYDEIPATNYKTIYFISKTSLFYYDTNSQQWKHLQEEFVNNTNYDVVPTIMRNSNEISYKTYTDGVGGGTIGLRTADGFLRARSATSGPGGDWSSPLDDFTLVNKGYLREELKNFEPTGGSNLGYEIVGNKDIYYTIHYNNVTSFSEGWVDGKRKTYYKVSAQPVTLDFLRYKCISIETHTYQNDYHTQAIRIGEAELVKAKTYTGGTYLYSVGIWIVTDYTALSGNPGFTSNGTYFVREEWDQMDNAPGASTYLAYTQTTEIFTGGYRQIDPVYVP